jgi:ribonuclease HII
MIGVDEVGRGCWAGPLLVVAARAVRGLPSGLTDSKLLSKIQRKRFLAALLLSCQFGEGWVSAQEIDKYGLAHALRLGISRALKSINAQISEEIILDGKVNYVGKEFVNARCEVDADLNIALVSAASIFAKVTRDKFMAELSLKHPLYGFEKHVGYGTKAHKLVLQESGVLEGIHRMSFKPVAALLQ